MKLKMPGPGGIITLVSDPDIALRAENKTAALALEALSEALAADQPEDQNLLGNCIALKIFCIEQTLQ